MFSLALRSDDKVFSHTVSVVLGYLHISDNTLPDLSRYKASDGHAATCSTYIGGSGGRFRHLVDIFASDFHPRE